MSGWVGKNLRRPEGKAKVDGTARYVADLRVPGAWVGGVVRAPVPAGRLLGLDLDPGFDFGSVVVVRAEDIPGENVIAMIADDQPMLCTDRIRHFGEPLLLCAAPDRATLRRALAAITPRVAPDAAEPAVFDMEQSAHAFHEIAIDKGDVEAGFMAAARVFEGTYRTDSQEQLYIEPQGMVAYPPEADGTVRVVGSMQCPYYVQKSLCRMLGVPPDRARVVQAETGGGFGGKEDYPSVVACHAALLARAAGRPVRIVYDRHEDLLFTPKRHPSRVRHRTAVDGEGKLLAMDVDVLLDGGAYTTLSPVVLSRAVIHAAGPYRCANVRIRGKVVCTNHVPYGAFRGFGVPQTCFAVERQMDRIARGMGRHPVELRRRNMLRAGDSTATGQVLSYSVGSEEVMERILARTGIDRDHWCGIGARGSAENTSANGNGRVRKRRGRGLSFFFHGAGFTGAGEEHLKGTVEVELTAASRVRVKAAATEIGQGTNAMLEALAADSLSVEPATIEIVPPDTGLVPNSGPTVASRTCMIVGGSVAKACRELAARIGGGPDESFAARAARFLAAGGDPIVRVTYASPPGIRWDEESYRGDAYPVYGWAADVVEVELDLDSFEVDIVRFWTAVDVGKAIQPILAEGQIEGGSLQALGFAHLEVVSAEDGRFRQDRLATCVIPTTMDAPPMDVELVEVPYPHGPFGAKGIGELPMDGGAAAVAAAIEDATGMHIDRIPASPERLLAQWLALHPEEVL